MIPEYVWFMLCLVALTYVLSTLTEMILMIKEFNKTNETKKNEGLGVLFQ